MHTPKLVLRRLVAIGFVGLALAFAAVLIKAGQPSATVQNARTVTVEVPVLQPGQLVQIDVQGKPLFLLKPDAAQTASLRALDAHVWAQESANWVEELQAFAYWGISTKWGCPLQEMPKESATPALGQTWLGGYWDPRCEVSYDYAGRAVRNAQYTFNGYILEVKNLQRPAVLERVGGKLQVSAY